jgi:putative protease
MCTQACRRQYRQASGESGYYFSPNDLQLLERVPDLAAAGVSALKIEGRMKSASYVGAVVSAYRLVTDAVAQGDEDQIRQSIEQGREILRNDFARAKTQYFFNKGRTSHEGAESHGEGKVIDWLNPEQDGGTGISLGTILKVKGAGDERRALIRPTGGPALSARDSVRIHKTDDSGRISHKLAFAEREAGGGYWISIPEGATGDHVYLIQTKAMSKRYAPLITQVSGGKGPGREKAPLPQIQTAGHKEADGKHFKKDEVFPEGLYTAVSSPEDLYIVQSSRPQRVMLALTHKNAKYLLDENKPPLPFKPTEVILKLDPWFPQEDSSFGEDNTAGEIAKLIDRGYFQYELNNPGHFSLFRSHGNVKLIAGPWLYMFNSWSLSFIASLGVDGFVSPLENNRQNLERTVRESRVEKGSGKKRQEKNALHSKFFITVFAWPPLFSIRADLGAALDFKSFTDNRDERFLLVTGKEGSRVYPDNYFSIIDKIPFLKEAGFGRFIIDLSGRAVKKHDYRDLMRAVNDNAPLPHSSRFNWKDGFFRESESR